jgi:gamma-glutamylaminecyclotransferase
VAGPWYAPMLLNRPGLGRRVIGELYELNDAILARIDPLESMGQPGHLRITLKVEAISGGETCDALAYAKEPELATPVSSGYLNDYRDRRFIPPWRRHSHGVFPPPGSCPR